ncbi:hypothetical protein [Leptothermofonsia sp. ETS-13]
MIVRRIVWIVGLIFESLSQYLELFALLTLTGGATFTFVVPSFSAG